MVEKPRLTWTWDSLNKWAVFLRETYPERRDLQRRIARASRKRRRRQRFFQQHPEEKQARIAAVRAWWQSLSPAERREKVREYEVQRRARHAILYPRQVPTDAEVLEHRRAVARAKKRRYYQRYPEKRREARARQLARHGDEIRARRRERYHRQKGPVRPYHRRPTAPDALKVYEKARAHAYYMAHKPEYRARKKVYRARHRVEINRRRRERVASDPVYAQRNRDRVRAWKYANPEKYRAKKRRQRQRRRERERLLRTLGYAATKE